ncbi:diguanylate cyclase (GGDEF) domain-containing protein [Lachnospiraceae bacterium C7]|nr:diguanylate cyclase (GGDEF) domain-containing protein [Lachnospiraceae bacterium C7]
MDLNQEIITMWTVFHVFFIFFAVTIYCKIGSDFGAEREIKVFRGQIITYVIYLVASLNWTYDLMGVIKFNGNEKMWCAVTCQIAAAISMYCWVKYGLYHLHINVVYNSLFEKIFAIPLIGLLLLNFSTFYNGKIFYLSKDKNPVVMYGKWYEALYYVFAFYFFFVAFEVIKKIFVYRKKINKSEALIFVGYIFFIAPVVLFTDKLKVLTVTPIAHFAAIFFTFVTLQETRIRTDALTGLNNRRVAYDFLKKSILESSQKEAVVLYMIDINYFKHVNDKWGHLEGDRALVIMGTALKKVANQRHCLVARYGGDEFIIVLIDKSMGKMKYDDVLKELSQQLKKECKKQDLEYILTISGGYARCSKNTMEPDKLIEKADEMLYERKKEHHKKYKSGENILK